jgi:hypothetical protein
VFFGVAKLVRKAQGEQATSKKETVMSYQYPIHESTDAPVLGKADASPEKWLSTKQILDESATKGIPVSGQWLQRHLNKSKSLQLISRKVAGRWRIHKDAYWAWLLDIHN